MENNTAIEDAELEKAAAERYWLGKDREVFKAGAKWAALQPKEAIEYNKKYMDGLTGNYGQGGANKYQYTGKKCVAGCKNFTGYETKHHKDCPYYPGSLSEKYDKMELAAQPKQEAIEGEDLLKLIKEDGVNFFLSNILRHLEPDEMQQLSDKLIRRLPKPESIQGDAVEFAEWIKEENYNHWNNIWEKQQKEFFTSEELYKLFLNSK